MSKKLICIIDATHLPEMISFQIDAIGTLLKSYQFHVEYMVIISNQSAYDHFNPQLIKSFIWDKHKNLADFINVLNSQIDEGSFLLWTETNLLPDKNLISKINSITHSNSIYVPETAYSFHNAHTVYEYKQSDKVDDLDWKSPYLGCFITLLNSPLIASDIHCKSYGVSIRESLFQYLTSIGRRIHTVKHSVAVGHTNSLSWSELFHKNNHSAFFAKPNFYNDKNVLISKTESDKVIQSRTNTRVPLNSESKKSIQTLSEVDPRLKFLADHNIRAVNVKNYYYSEATLYRKLTQSLLNSDYIIVLHQLRRGGAEKEAILHLKAYCELYPQRKVSLILTLTPEPDLQWQLPKQVQVVEFGRDCQQFLNEEEQVYLLYRILDQVNPRILHVKCSSIGWYVIARYGSSLAKKMKIWASIYCIDYNMMGFATSYGFRDLPYAAPSIHNLLADNSIVLQQMRQIAHLSKMTRLRYPVDKLESEWTPQNHSNKMKVLWCSRLSFQKDLTTLKKVIQLFPEIEFHIYGEISDDAEIMDEFSNLPNAILWGIFDSLLEIDINQYDLFLYTSYWDGFPNILLEVGMYGIPIIAPRLPGIAEVLDDTNSMLYSDLNELVKILSRWGKSPTHKEKAIKLKDKISAEYTWENFYSSCKELYE